jgi:hypothetical protein
MAYGAGCGMSLTPADRAGHLARLLAAVANARVRAITGFPSGARFATVVGRAARDPGELVRGKLQGAALLGLALNSPRFRRQVIFRRRAVACGGPLRTRLGS